MRRVKSEPERMCISCGSMQPKSALYRVVCDKNGTAAVDLSGKMQGRGAYVCRSTACIRKAEKKRAFTRSLHHSVPQQIYEQLAGLAGGQPGEQEE